MNLRSFVAVVCAGAFMGSAFGAGGSGFGSGIADVRVDRATARKAKVGAPDRERGGAITATDQDSQSGQTSSPPPPTICDFIGFPNKDIVNGAYGGGSSTSGVALANLGVNFSGLTVLNSWNGSNSPDASVAYSPSGAFIMSSSNGAQWRGMTFHYSTTVPLTVQTFAGENGSGTMLETFTIPANLSAAPFNSWTQRQIQFASVAKSVRMSGAGNYWGIDALSVASGCPAPASASDDCNGNGQSDACEIAYGLVQDCNGNGKPDSCDITGTPPVPGAVQWRIADGGNGHWYLPMATADRVTWEAAKDLAASMGGHLATLASAPEDAFVFGLVSGRPELWNRNAFGGPWLGAYQPNPMSAPAEGWVWVTGEPWNFTNWAGGEPGDQGWRGGRESYLQYRDLSGGWNDFTNEGDVNRNYSLVVEWDSSGSLADCNANGVIDSCEIASGAVADCNGNGIPDTCDIAAGLATDCNANGAIDSCELASGAAVDQNGNGIPDTCDPTPTLVLTANAAACNAVGSEVDMEARLSGVLNLVVAGQLVLDWDPSKLELVSSNAGDAPYVTSYLVNNASGQAVILVSAAPGGSGTTSQSAIVSRLRFRVLGGSCDGSGTSVGFGSFAGMLTTTFTDGFGTSVVPTLVSSSGFVVDDGAPVLSNVPANVSVQAFAGEGGSAFVTLGTPTATDACAPGLTATGVRSDGQALGAAWPSGTTTVTWSATDPCGNTTTATTSVTVDPTNTMDLAANFVSPFGFSDPYGGGGASRTLTVSVKGTAGVVSRTPSVFVGRDGAARFSITDLPADAYGCVVIEHVPNSLRARVSVSDTGSVWSAETATLVLGDIIDDEVIDVLDWGAYIVRNPNADLNADGFIGTDDGNVILANFGRKGDAACTPSLTGPREALTAVSVSDLVALGMPELAGADLNGDGMLDTADMELAGN